jgi:phosphonopyruvate decarboxylase
MAPGDVLAATRRVRRDDDVVITTMGAAREWMALGAAHPRDLIFVPSSMGQATSVGLGIAIARPELRVIVCNGDGSMLMNLGSLVTITAAGATNLVVLLFDNGVYEVTGAQPTPAADVGRAGSAAGPDERASSAVDFGAMARAAGFRTVLRYSELDQWQREARQALDSPGPAFVVLDVSATLGAPAPRSPGPPGERARRFMEALGGSAG